MSAGLALMALQCHVVSVDFVPSDQLQIVAWVEKPDGTYIDTIYITQKTGRFGMANRPGRYDFNSGPIVKDMWPYGRRVNTFPVWAHRHGLTFPRIVFQDGGEDDLSHSFYQSSAEHTPPFCRPMSSAAAPVGDGSNWDAGTCPSASYTDKGTFDPGGATSLYPPRADLTRVCSNNNCDSPSVTMYKSLDPFDAVAQATPIAGALAEITWPIPPELPDGDYVLWIETGKAFDFNSSYNPTVYPPPNVSYSNYGLPYRGQPSIVYRVPFTLGPGESVTTTDAYLGYGDVDGATGTLHPPDATITTDTPGSGAARLQILPGTTSRLRVDARNETDAIPPAPAAGLLPMSVTPTSIALEFVAPGDDGLGGGTVSGYDVRYRTFDPMTADNFDDDHSSPIAAAVTPAAPGGMQTVTLEGLLPQTPYWIGVRAYDDCHNQSAIAIVQVQTAAPVGGYVDACFVATAAYGSTMAGDVELLRRMRDSLLRRSVLGELAIEAYYTFGPPVARVVGESELLRAGARSALVPLVTRLRTAAF